MEEDVTACLTQHTHLLQPALIVYIWTRLSTSEYFTKPCHTYLTESGDPPRLASLTVRVIVVCSFRLTLGGPIRFSDWRGPFRRLSAVV
ncbi:hypothetical protein LIA77_01156 [Sarocladium implicatum]|nr:hypothetical protein LIA77_01156 [Sarocladium implicatum]